MQFKKAATTNENITASQLLAINSASLRPVSTRFEYSPELPSVQHAGKRHKTHTAGFQLLQTQHTEHDRGAWPTSPVKLLLIATTQVTACFSICSSSSIPITKQINKQKPPQSNQLNKPKQIIKNPIPQKTKQRYFAGSPSLLTSGEFQRGSLVQGSSSSDTHVKETSFLKRHVS